MDAGAGTVAEGELAGPRIVISADPQATASALAARLGAELIGEAAEAERALARLRRRREGDALRADAREAFTLARVLAGSDEAGDLALEAERHRMAEDAALPDPAPLLERLDALAGAVARAEREVAAAAEALLEAETAADAARARGADAVPAGTAFDRDAVLALAERIRDATARVAAAQASLGPRPTLADEEARHVALYSERIAGAEQAVETLRRTRTRLLLVSSGGGFAAAGLAMQVGIGAPALAAPALAVLATGAHLRRSSAQARATLDAARRAGSALVTRLLPDQGVDDPTAAWGAVVAAWEASAGALRSLERDLVDLQREWSAVAGRLDPDRVEAQLEAARDLAAAGARAAGAGAVLEAARGAHDAALREWREALAEAGVEPRPPKEADELRLELEQWRRRRSAALATLAQVDDAGRRREARRRLAELLAGRSIDDLARAADEAAAGHAEPSRPVVLADPLAGMPRDHWDGLRRTLTAADGVPCVLVTSEAEAATWGLTPLEG